MRDPRLKKLADLLINYSVKVKKGEMVFIQCDEACTPWMIEVARAAVKAGARVETRLSSQEVDEVKLKYGNKEQLLSGNFLMEQVVRNADVFLTAWGGRNTRINAGIDAEKIKTQARGDKKWRTIFSERMGSGELRWCGTQFPTHSDAQEAGMSLCEYEEFVYGAGLLESENPEIEWEKISRRQEKWISYLNTKQKLHIKSRGTDLTVDISGRKWINCDGRVNFPDGEIFTSPVENGIDGHITFSFPGIHAGKEIRGIRLEVEKGTVVSATAEKGEDLLHALLKTDSGASRFGEVAIGTNYGIKTFTRNMLFDEKIGGTVHLALGDSMEEAGGKNRSSIHWDMLCDMRSGGKIYADGELFHENGEFIEKVADFPGHDKGEA